MAKHLLDEDKTNLTKKSNKKLLWGRIISRQGEGLIEKDKKIECLEEKLKQERMDRIEDLKTIESWATSNCYNNERALLRKINKIASEKRKKLLNGSEITNKKIELSISDKINNR